MRKLKKYLTDTQRMWDKQNYRIQKIITFESRKWEPENRNWKWEIGRIQCRWIGVKCQRGNIKFED